MSVEKLTASFVDPIVPPKYSESSVMIEVDQVLPAAVVSASTAAFGAGRAALLV